MKLKEKKFENTVEEVVEVDNKLLEYLEFSRECEYQFAIFARRASFETCTREINEFYEEFGVDISAPVQIIDGFTDDSVAEEFDKFIQEWIDAFNKLNLDDIDNYTRFTLFARFPSTSKIRLMKRRFKKCE